jgi:3-isopropylmalate/(R)-2-methylmalate dehydratase small subunit
MQPFTTLTGVAAPLERMNVDTDMIIPKQFLKTIKRTGLGTALFAEMRYHDDGSENAGFVLNQPAYRKCRDFGGGRQFRLRLVARACAMGPARFWHSLRHLHELCRYLLQ